MEHYLMRKKMKWFKKFMSAQKGAAQYSQTYLYDLTQAAWSDRNYQRFAEEGYRRNVIANRCVSLIARSAASVDWLLYENHQRDSLIKAHPLLRLLHKPNPRFGGAEFFEAVYSHKLIAGNTYILAVRDGSGQVVELHLLRPDRVEIAPGSNGMAAGYFYKIDDDKYYYPVDNVSGQCDVLHLRNFNPMDDWYGMSPVEAASYSIDLHNQSSEWNQSLLQNGARPSGALVIKNADSKSQLVDSTKMKKLRRDLEKQFVGVNNTGRPLLLEGGLDWLEMSINPKDMDFVEAKNSAARDIALAFGVPPQLLGIKGDNTYNNMQEARLAFWEETVLPLVDKTVDAVNNWIVEEYPGGLELSYNTGEIGALALKKEKLWDRVNRASFLTDEEKRTLLGLSTS